MTRSLTCCSVVSHTHTPHTLQLSCIKCIQIQRTNFELHLYTVSQKRDTYPISYTLSRKFTIKLLLKISLRLNRIAAQPCEVCIFKIHTDCSHATADHSTHPAAQSAVVWIIFSPRSWFEETLTENLAEAISYTRLTSSKQLLNDIVLIWFTDINLFALATMKKSHNNRLYASAATRKKHVDAKRYLRTRMTFTHSLIRCRRVKICLHRFDVSLSQSQNRWNLLLWLAFTTIVAACYTSAGLWRVLKQCSSVRFTLVFWH